MMTSDRFPLALQEFWLFDGLKDDHATGEKFATSFGVTVYTWNSAWDQGIVDSSIENATKDQCAAILRAMFWNAVRCPEMPAGVDLMLFNDATLSGVGHTTKLLQRIVGVTADGIIGPVTIGAVAKLNPFNLVTLIAAADEKYLQSLANAPLYLRGWLRREDEMKSVAERWIKEAAS